MANPHTYAMISTMNTQIKVRLPTTITIAGSHHQQIVHIKLNQHNRNIMGRAYAGLFQNPLTQSINPSVPIPKVHQTKGLTGRKIEKMAWALTLLQDPNTLRTYENFAREAAYETEDTQPYATSPPTRRAQHHPTPPTRHRRHAQTYPSQEGTSTGTTIIDVDQDLPERTTPLGMPFEDDYTAYQQRGASFEYPPARVRARNFFTPLYTESQQTNHTTANTDHRTPQPPYGGLDLINEAEEEELLAAEAAEADAHRTSELEV